MTRIRIYLIVLLAIISSGFSTAGATIPLPSEFRSVTENSGRPLSGLTSLTFDDDGFIWAGSRMGIIRATPSDCRIFELPANTSNVMQVKVAYNKGVTAASTQNGQAFLFDPVKCRFKEWFSLNPILGKKDWVTNFLIDGEGRPWVSTSKGIFLKDDNGLRQIEGNGYSYILPISGTELFAIIDKEIFIINTSDLSRRRVGGEFGQLISAGAYDTFNNSIWLGTYQGELWRYDIAAGRFDKMSSAKMPGFIIRSLIIADPETLLAGFEGGGVIFTDSRTGEVNGILKEDIDKPGSLKGNSVTAMALDGRKRLWTATTNGGLQFSEIDNKYVEHINHRIGDPSSLPNNNINGLMTDSKGRLWIATNNGISRQDRETGELKHILGGRELSVLSMAQGKDGKVYVSTYTDGVYVLDEETGKTLDHFTEKDSGIFSPGAFVFATFTDSDGDIWFGGVKGDVLRYSPEEKIFRKYGQHPVFCFAEHSPGKILTGGGDGLIMFDKETGKEETILPENVVEDIIVDGDMVWACTAGNGVIVKDLTTGKVRSITTKEGLHSNFTCSLIRRGDYLWVSTLRGMSCYDLKEGGMVTLPAGELLTRNAFRENSVTSLPDGKLAFGTNDGVVIFDPDTVRDVNTAGKIYFSDIRLSGQSIRDNEKYELDTPIDNLRELKIDYPKNSFTLSVLPLGNIGSNVGYSWKLDGSGDDWSEITPLNYVNYANLPPGNYTLHIRMYDGGIVAERSLKVTVKPPFWKRGWFRGLNVVIIILLAALIIRLYILRMEQHYARDKIGSFTQMTRELRKSLLTIKAPIDELEKEENLSDRGRKYTEAAQEEIGKLYGTLNRLLEFEKEENPTEQPNFVATDLAAIVKKGTVVSVETGPNNEFLRKAEESVKNNLGNENFGKGEFASDMMISQSLLYKKIKMLTGMSVVEFIRSIRLNRAKELLEEGKNNVTEVSEICGFSSSAYFSRVFKEYFGKTPSEIISSSQNEKTNFYTNEKAGESPADNISST